MLQIANITRAANGWVVSLSSRNNLNDTDVLCLTWDDVINVLTAHAFPYPDKTEPRG